MKVIGKLEGDSFLVAITATELARCAGYHSAYSADFRQAIGGSEIKIGAEIHVTQAYSFIEELRSKSKQCADAAGILKHMAEMITSGLPETIVGETIKGA